MRIKLQSILYGLFAVTVIGVQLQDVLTFFSPTVNRMLGIIMAGILILILAGNRECLQRVLNTEILLWVVFLAWSGLTGFLVVKNTSSFTSMLFYLAQQTIIVMAAILITIMYGSVNRILYVVFMIPFIFIVYLFASGQSHYILSLTTGYGSNYLGQLLNANTIAFWNISGLISYFVFRRSLKKRTTKVICFIAAVLYFYMIIQSGSRKSFLAAVLFLVLMYLINQIFAKKSSAAKTIGLLLAVFAGYIAFDFFLPELLADTYLGQRLLNFYTDSSNEKRIEMIMEAFGYFAQSPIWGIGINQFQHYTVFGYYSHCDIAEVLCSTGLVGGLLYISIYTLSFRKLYIIFRRYRNSNTTLYNQSGTLLAGLVTIVFIGFGNVSFESLSHWLLLSAIIAFTQLNNKQERSKKNTGRLTARGTRYL